MSKYFKILLCIFIIWIISLAGCSLGPSQDLQNNKTENSETSDSGLIIVGFSQLGSESDWRTANTKSIQNALVKKNGFSLIYSNGRQSQENQIKDIRRFIFQKVDYILIAPVTETGWDTVLTEAKEAGIPVIIVDRMIDTTDPSLYVASVGTNKYLEGQKAGMWLEKYLKEQQSAAFASLEQENENDSVQGGGASSGESVSPTQPVPNSEDVNIVVLEGTPDSTAQIGRSNGFEDIALRNSNWHILAHESADFTKAKGKEIMAKYLQEFPDIDVLVSQNDDMTFGAIEAIQEAGLTCGVDGKIKIISFDAVSEAFDKMEAGLINVDIECNPLQGEMIAQIIGRIEKGETVDKESYLDGKVFEAENAAKDRIGRTY